MKIMSSFQVQLWTDQTTVSESSLGFPRSILTQDIETVLPKMRNTKILKQLKEIGPRADLLRYEVMEELQNLTYRQCHFFQVVVCQTQSIIQNLIYLSMRP